MLLESLLLVAKVTLAVGQEVISGPDEHQLCIQTHKSLQLEAFHPCFQFGSESLRHWTFLYYLPKHNSFSGQRVDIGSDSFLVSIAAEGRLEIIHHDEEDVGPGEGGGGEGGEEGEREEDPQ